MPLTCPQCNTPLKALKVKNYFNCPKCATELKGKVIIPSLIAVALLSLADWMAYPTIYTYTGSDWWPGFTLRMAIDTAVYFLLMMVLVKKLGMVEVA